MHALTHFVSSKIKPKFTLKFTLSLNFALNFAKFRAQKPKFKLKFTLKFKLKSVPHLNFSLKIPLILCPFIHAQAKLIITLRACWGEFGADYVAHKEI